MVHEEWEPDYAGYEQEWDGEMDEDGDVVEIERGDWDAVQSWSKVDDDEIEEKKVRDEAGAVESEKSREDKEALRPERQISLNSDEYLSVMLEISLSLLFALCSSLFALRSSLWTLYFSLLALSASTHF